MNMGWRGVKPPRGINWWKQFVIPPALSRCFDPRRTQLLKLLNVWFGIVALKRDAWVAGGRRRFKKSIKRPAFQSNGSYRCFELGEEDET